MGLQPRALCGWFSKGHHPSAEMLFRVTSALRMSLSELIEGCATHSATTPVPNSRRRVRHSEEVRKRVLSELMAATRAADPPPLRAIALKHGVSRTYLPYWFPRESRALTRRREILRETRFAAERLRRLAILKGAIRSQLSDRGKVVRRRTEKLLKADRVSLLLPDVRASFQAMARRRRPEPQQITDSKGRAEPFEPFPSD